MAWSYSGNPGANNRDSVRFLLGDTDDTDEQLQDEEVDWLLSTNNDDVYEAAIDGAMSLVAKYSRMVNRTVGDLSVEAQEYVTHYNVLIERLKTMRSRKKPAAGIFIGNDSQQRLFEIGDMDFSSDYKDIGN